MRFLRSFLLASSKPKLEIPNYDGGLSTKVLLDWINELDKYFECEEVVKIGELCLLQQR